MPVRTYLHVVSSVTTNLKQLQAALQTLTDSKSINYREGNFIMKMLILTVIVLTLVAAGAFSGMMAT